MVYGVNHLKKRENTILTWHGRRCEPSNQMPSANVPKYNLNNIRRSDRTCYFGPQPKLGAPGTMETNPIEIRKEDGELPQEN